MIKYKKNNNNMKFQINKIIIYNKNQKNNNKKGMI